jgi:hypothetical protein
MQEYPTSAKERITNLYKTKNSTVKNVKEALNKQGNILMLPWKENMNLNTLLNLGVLGLWCLIKMSKDSFYDRSIVTDLL